MHPGENTGHNFWERIHSRTHAIFGDASRADDSLHKIWIVPHTAVVYEHDRTAYVIESSLKVMLEEDYLARKAGVPGADDPGDNSTVTTEAMRTILLPEIEHEVNTGAHFAPLRQIYNAVILASWYKDNLRDSLLGQIYVDQGKIRGIDTVDPAEKEKIYEQYLETIRGGVVNIIREDYDPVTRDLTHRKYFTGGSSLEVESIRRDVDDASLSNEDKIYLDRAMLGSEEDEHQIQVALVENIIPADISLRIDLHPNTRFPNPKKLGLTDNQLPRPPIKIINNRIVPYWLLLNGLVNFILKDSETSQKPITLDAATESRLVIEFYQRYGIKDATYGGQLKLESLFEHLDEMGFVERRGEKIYAVTGTREDMLTWSRNDRLVTADLDSLFTGQDTFDPDSFDPFARNYEHAAQKNSLSLVKPYQPFLRGVLGLSPGRRQAIADYLKSRYFTGDQAPYTGGVLIDSLMLILHRIDDLPRWAKAALPDLSREGQRIYLSAPEVTLLAGGLGRVMQYLARALKEMDLDVVIKEPYYAKRLSYNKDPRRVEENDLDYEKLYIPLDIPDAPEFTFEITVEGRRIEVDVFQAMNDENIPVYLYRDRQKFYTRALYKHGDGVSYPTPQGLIEFISKASRKLGILLETKRKEDLEQQGREWIPAIDASNDGQSLLANMWQLFDPEYQGEVALEMPLAATNHTVLNTFKLDYEQIKNMVPAGFRWIMKMRDPYGNEVYDATAGGIISTQLTKGFTNSVSETHADNMRRVITENYGKQFGLTNGDLVSLTNRHFNRKFINLYGSAEQKNRVLELEEKLKTSGSFQKAAARRAIDEYINSQFWAFVDSPGRSKEELKNVLSVIKKELKMDYLNRHVRGSFEFQEEEFQVSLEKIQNFITRVSGLSGLSAPRFTSVSDALTWLNNDPAPFRLLRENRLDFTDLDQRARDLINDTLSVYQVKSFSLLNEEQLSGLAKTVNGYYIKRQILRLLLPEATPRGLGKSRLQDLNIRVPDGMTEENFWQILASKPWVGYSGRWVREKDGRRRAFTDENLRRLVEEYDIVPIILANPQYYEGTDLPGQSLYSAIETLNLARDINASPHESKFIFSMDFDLEEQLVFLNSIEAIIMDSETLRLREYLLPTGASESTEIHSLGLNIGPSENHGFIQGIGNMLDWLEFRGTNPVPADSSPEAYAEIYARIAEAHSKGSLYDHVLDSLTMFRSLDVLLTAYAYARSWDKTIPRHKEWLRDLTRGTRLPLEEVMRQYYENLARPEREVSISAVAASQDTDYGIQQYETETTATGDIVLHVSPRINKDRPVLLELIVDTNGIDPDKIHARVDNLSTNHTYELPGETTQNGQITFYLALDKLTGSSMSYLFRVSGGMWNNTKKIIINTALGPREKRAIMESSNGKFDVRFKGAEGDQKMIRPSGGVVSARVSLPFAPEHLIPQVKLGVWTNTLDGNWRFLYPDEYKITRSVSSEGTLIWDVSFSSQLSGEVTFALLDDTDKSTPHSVISWARPAGDNMVIMVDKTDPAEKPVVLSNPSDKAVLTVNNLGGIDLTRSALNLQIKRDGRGLPLPASAQPLGTMKIEGFLPVIIHIRPIPGLPWLLGIAEPEEQRYYANHG
jgi:hypothetical protein